MGKFRKRPVVIEAWQWLGRGFETDTPAWVFDYSHGVSKSQVRVQQDGTLSVPTLEGNMTAQIGDWLIQGVKGEIYPCKPDIFEQMYEPVEDE